MNPVVAAFLLAPTVLAAPRLTLDLADRTEVRGGAFGLPTDPAVHAETIPSIGLLLATRATEFGLIYAPRLTLTDLQLGLNFSQLQSGSAGASWHARAIRLSLTEYASYGTLNYSMLQLPSSVPGTVRVDPLLRRIITYEGSSTALNVLLNPYRRWLARLTLSYTLSGAAKEVDRDVLPLFHGPKGELAFEYAIFRRTYSVTRAALEDATVSTGHEYLIASVVQGVRQRFGVMTDAEVGAGVTEVRSDLPPPLSERRTDTYGTVEAAFSQRVPYRDRFDVQVRGVLGPGINRVTGLVTQQLQVLLRSGLRSYPWVSAFEGGISSSIHDEPGGLKLISGQLGVGYFFSKVVQVEAGGRLAWQEVVGADTATVQKLLFVGLTLRQPTIVF